MLAHLKWHCRNAEAAEAVVQGNMKSNFRNYIQTVLDQVHQSTEAYQLHVRALSRHLERR